MSFESQSHNDVPFLIVVNANDTVDPIQTVKTVFPWMKTHSAAPHYAALFTHMPAGWRARATPMPPACWSFWMSLAPKNK